MLGINLKEQGIPLLLNGTLTEKSPGNDEFIDREQGRKSETFKGSREHATPPPRPRPGRPPFVARKVTR